MPDPGGAPHHGTRGLLHTGSIGGTLSGVGIDVAWEECLFAILWTTQTATGDRIAWTRRVKRGRHPREPHVLPIAALSFQDVEIRVSNEPLQNTLQKLDRTDETPHLYCFLSFQFNAPSLDRQPCLLSRRA